ncbi:hypothetical protein Aph02nite_25040 [Actinoplanes philippinensis]|uniref:Lysophospholipase L1 n=1 Tax=Actinoplanes philippinensis TaxID=35752 RepID=A0A1I2G4M5_9ACTN|nr:SGNH/GDSL hydrolase family protein [Actinoplanes philippinensis]GIE76554.1 hypothetical protein Aph02nite_25040 [Actinoplanes philippinensis]SFF11726.1 Lysophospholipase L1 [Actinoplanes philippinensis]
MNALLLPVVAAQAMWKRRRTVSIPSAEGPATGVVPGMTPRHPLRVVILGDSLAAGYGVHTHDEGFGGSLARDLVERTGRTVEWTAVGQYGATARRIRYRLLPQIPDKADIVVIVGGANDVLGGRQPHEWGEDLAAVADESSRRAGRVMVAGIPPFEHLPCMPRTLGRHLAARAVALDEVSQRVCDERPAATWVPGKLLLPFVPAYFSPDGFHPSSLGYRRWSAAVAGEIPL